MFGDRYAFMPYWLVNACVNRNWIFVTLDYRLIPETTVHDSLQDACDAYKWVLEQLPAHINIDIGSVVLAGSSAGAYLALMVASLTTPRPTALLSIYGMLDPAHKRYTAQGTNLFGRPVFDTKPVLSNLASLIQRKDGKVLSGYPVPANLNDDPRFSLVSALHIEALLPDCITGVQGLSSSIARYGVDSIPQEHRKLFPLSFGRLDLPPTFIFHGQNDAAIPCDVSKVAMNIMHRSGIEVQSEFPEDAQHGFDARIGRMDLEKGSSDELETPAFQGLRNILKQLDETVARKSDSI